MGNSNGFSLIKSSVINGITVDCYAQEGNHNVGEEFWLTREQIGRLLGYNNPKNAIGKIHERNRERLDQFSTVRQIDTPSRGTQTATLYNFKGLLEICRFSNQPKANEVINRLWDIAYEIKCKGYYAVPAVQSQIDALTQENKILREQVGLLQAQCNNLKAYIQDNSSFTLLGQSITPVKGTVSVSEAAKIFAQHGIKIGQNRLFKLMRDLKLIAKRKGRQWNQPTQKSIEQGLCVIVLPLGSKGTPYLTLKGLQKVSDVLAKEQFPLLALLPGDVALHE
ncbi:MAG: phage antirepressor KilAC domain-containing protein [Synergistaceae bacterium]|nr:phage antirepressor KilAC domain-containing protein [Synergistaceae bacterium]MBQ4400972.1 phage antirepressor KilAC domain-containing protein [Synergistaceae bacterium]MBQ4430945.1 phage antirepressor KilAC domain-containing protein [Synergistaceae bacterium]